MCSATALLWERMRSRSASSSHALLLTCTTFLPPRCLGGTKQGPDQIRSSKDNPPEDEKAGQLHWRCPGASPCSVVDGVPVGWCEGKAKRLVHLQQRVPTVVVITPVDLIG